MEILHLNSENFENEVLNSEGTVFVDFYADWCGPCKMMGPVVDSLAQDLQGQVKVCKINIDDAQEIAEKYEVMTIPTFIVFKNGEPVARSIGVQPKDELMELLK